MSGTRDQILAAALALAADQGVSATSVDDIAARAQVSKGSVFYNFGTKSAVFEAIISEGVTLLTAHLREAATGLHGQAAIDAVVAELLVRISERPDFAKFAVAELFRTGRDWQDSIRQVREQTIGSIVEIVTDAWPERDATLTAAAIFGATLITGLIWLVFEPERDVAEVRAAILASLA
jgi:AcrR family transcriptional regulator